MISLDPIAIVYKDRSGKFQQQEIPAQTLLIRDQNNSVLQADIEKIDDNSESLGLLNRAVQASSSALPREARAILGSTLNRNRRNFSSQERIYQLDVNTDVSVFVNSILTTNYE